MVLSKLLNLVLCIYMNPKLKSCSELGSDVKSGEDGAMIGITNLEMVITPSILEDANT